MNHPPLLKKFHTTSQAAEFELSMNIGIVICLGGGRQGVKKFDAQAMHWDRPMIQREIGHSLKIKVVNQLQRFAIELFEHGLGHLG